MPAPEQMFKHMLNPVAGWHIHSLVFVATPAPSVNLSDLKAGMVVSLNNNGQLVLGAKGHAMPLFAFQSGTEPVVDNTYDPTFSNQFWVPATPTGSVSCLVAVGAYELASTEFDTTQTYLPNDLLRAPNGTLTNSGVKVVSDINNSSESPHTHATLVVGVVSRGVFTNKLGVKMLQFWPVYIPGRASE